MHTVFSSEGYRGRLGGFACKPCASEPSVLGLSSVPEEQVVCKSPALSPRCAKHLLPVTPMTFARIDIPSDS